LKQLHRITGIIVAVFIILHLFNHSMAWFGVETHQKILDTFRSFYRIPIIEIILVSCFMFQIFSGIKLLLELRKKKDKTNYEKIQMFTGIALAYFIIQHIPATIGQRMLHGFDTNFYFASRVVIQKPWLYYFVPYYFIGVMVVGLHIANVHRHKISDKVGIKTANLHFYAILTFFVLLALIILYSLMGGRFEIVIPEIYNVY
jgi:succinate dehydrogenase/fumarate reductase cytochrome b subunit